MVMILFCVTAFSLPAKVSSQELGVCLVDSLNGKERKQLVQWIFFSIAAHPEIKPFSNITNEDRDEIDEHIGTMITRLLTEDCSSQLKKAYDADPNTIGKAFEFVGQVAMQEVFQNQEVMAAIQGFSKHADKDKIDSLLK